MKQDFKDRIGNSGLIIFDGSCGACSAFIGERFAFFRKRGFEVVPLQEEWVKELTGLSEDALLQAIHLLTPEGKILRGVDCFQYFCTKVWWLTPLARLLRIPFLRPVNEWLYNLIAMHRRKISAVCGLQSRAIYKDKGVL